MASTKQRMPRRPRSVVWYYFDKLANDPFKAKCKLCHSICQHGTNTSNLFYHLKHKHPASYEEAEEQREQENKLYMELKAKAGKTVPSSVRGRGRGRGRPPGSGASKDHSLVTGTLAVIKTEDGVVGNPSFSPQALSSAGRKSFGGSISRGKFASLDVSSALMHWLAIDMLHPTIITKKGFKFFLSACGIRTELPSRKTISSTLMPKLAEDAKNTVRQDIAAASSIALTLETWTYRETQIFVTMTAHFIKDNWTMTSYVLDTFECTEDKTETNLATNLKRVTDEWGLTKNIVVLLSNVPDEVMSNAIVVNGWEELACFGNSLNRVVSDALASVSEFIRVHKKMSEASIYFYESIKAADALAAVQQQHSLPTNRLKQERPVLWTSTYAMMERLVEQYEAVNTVLCFLGKDHMCLCDDEVELIKDVIQILKPFQAAVEELCTEPYTCVSKLIPIATLLQQVTAASMSAEDQGTQTDLKNALISQMQQHFSNLENNPLLATATLLDPRFKQHAFTDAEALEAAQERLLLDTQTVVKTADPMDIKTAATSSASSASLWLMFDKKVVNAKALKTDVSEADNETRRFFKEVNILRTADPFQWWQLNEVQFPHLRVLAKKFLCVPATATDSNRLFTKEGIEFASRRDTFRPTHLNNMLFLNQNLI
ncbi:Zinc finger bed domain-containing protein 4 [Plakobranchus ocellatus]|uniref:Zinc finger bed domain-containing protein 4 n=1 Tax=Plakobranchus ocellatus TaxID=259542 RepID=A0AAV3ZLV5_9GAST|nr:Zinc finger bed domain-containing protein 4 [Plakobranchus ocellatus]